MATVRGLIQAVKNCLHPLGTISFVKKIQIKSNYLKNNKGMKRIGRQLQQQVFIMYSKEIINHDTHACDMF